MKPSGSRCRSRPFTDSHDEGSRRRNSARSSRDGSATLMSNPVPVRMPSNPRYNWESGGLNLSGDSEVDGFQKDGPISSAYYPIVGNQLEPIPQTILQLSPVTERQIQKQRRRSTPISPALDGHDQDHSKRRKRTDTISSRSTSMSTPSRVRPSPQYHQLSLASRSLELESIGKMHVDNSNTAAPAEDSKRMNRKRSVLDSTPPIEYTDNRDLILHVKPYSSKMSRINQSYVVPSSSRISPKVQLTPTPTVIGQRLSTLPSDHHSHKIAKYARPSSDTSSIGSEQSLFSKSQRQEKASSETTVWKSDETTPLLTEYICTPGTIKSLTMVNIMSHNCFSKKWSPGFNFIIGENGSGKSALLSAIVAGLGGKALDTGRATSMRDIIRNGQTKARIEIVLNNYPSRLYGEDIKIVRTLSREGSSRYQIRDSDGVLRSLGRQELNLVLSKLNIQVDNPLAILHQEMSRNFLRTKDPELLYGYFYRALLLGSCESLLKKSSSDVQNAVVCLRSKILLLQDLRLNEQELKQQVEVIEALRECKHTLSQLEKEYVWAVVKEHEEILKVNWQEHTGACRRLEAASKDKTNISSRKQQVENNLASFDEVWQSVNDDLNSHTTDYERKRCEAQNIKMTISEYNGKMKIASNQLQCFEDTLRNLQERMDKYKNNSANTYEKKMRELQEKKQNFNEQLRVHGIEMQELSQQHAEFELKVENATAMEKDIESELNELKRKILEKQGEQKQFEKAKHTKYAAYGQDMVRLVEIIKTTKWKSTPRGPLGCCFTVKNETWAPLVEYILESSLCSFAVDNQEDRKRLHEIIDQVYNRGNRRAGSNVKRPSLCLLPFGKKKINIGDEKSKCDYPTILDVIDFVDNDYVIYNWLIEASRVERILLFKDYAEACDMMKNRNKVPRNTIRGYSLDSYMFYPDPNFRALVQTKLKPLRFLKVTQEGSSSVSTADHLIGEIRMLGQERQVVETKLREIKAQVKQDRKVLNQITVQMQDITSRQNRLKSELRTLESSVFDESNIAVTWMDEIEATKERIATKRQEQAAFQEQVKSLESQLKDIGLKFVENEIANLDVKMNNLLEQKNSAGQKIAELERELRKNESLCFTIQKEKNETAEKYQNAKQACNAQIDIAKEYCERVTELSGTPEQIKLKWETLTAEVEKNQKKISQRNIIIHNYMKAKNLADHVDEEIKIMSTLIAAVRPKIKLLQDHFQRKILEYGISVRTCFRSLIKSRCYWGDLVMSHEDKTLVCYVSLDTTSENRAKRNLDAVNGQTVIRSKKGIMEYSGGMSGGERSFTTICFLIACWQLMDMPFYILDEFDVFMDAFNRRISQEILMNVARSKPHAQFFIFTPLPLDLQPPSGSIILKLFKDKSQNSVEKSGASQEERSKRRSLLKST